MNNGTIVAAIVKAVGFAINYKRVGGQNYVKTTSKLRQGGNLHLGYVSTQGSTKKV